MAPPETLPVKENHAVTAITCQAHLGLQICCGGCSLAESSQDPDLDGKVPLPRLAQSRLIQIPLKAFHGIGIVLNHEFIDQLTEGPEFPVLQPEVVRLSERSRRQADPPGEAFLLKTKAQLPQQLRQLASTP